MPAPSPPYDTSRKRPLELRVRDLYDTGGLSEVEAFRLSDDRKPADALYIVRALIDEGAVALEHLSIVGGAEPMQIGPEMLFNIWVSLAGHILRDATALGPEMERKRRFLHGVLFKLRVDSAFLGLQDGLTPEDAIAEADSQIPSGEPALKSTEGAPESS